MAVFKDGFNTWILNDGKYELLPPSEFFMDNQKIFIFDSKEGELRINPTMTKNQNLEAVIKRVKQSPIEGVTIRLPTPSGVIYIPHVKHISYLSDKELTYRQLH